MDGRVRLRYGHTAHDYTIREVGADEAGAVLKRYVAVATKTRTQFGATKDSLATDFAAEANRHPVFELVTTTPAQRPAATGQATPDRASLPPLMELRDWRA